MRNAENRVFEVGISRVCEVGISRVCEYDHVCIIAYISHNNVNEIKECLVEARRSPNALSGIGSRRNGLTMFMCSIMLLTLIVLTAFFGCELWRLNDESV